MNDFERWAISMLLCFATGAAVAHAMYQPQHNAIDALKAQIQFLMERKVVGFLVWDADKCVWKDIEKPH